MTLLPCDCQEIQLSSINVSAGNGPYMMLKCGLYGRSPPLPNIFLANSFAFISGLVL